MADEIIKVTCRADQIDEIKRYLFARLSEVYRYCMSCAIDQKHKPDFCSGFNGYINCIKRIKRDEKQVELKRQKRCRWS